MIAWVERRTLTAAVVARSHAAASATYASPIDVQASTLAGDVPIQCDIGGTSLASSRTFAVVWVADQALSTKKVKTRVVSTTGVLGLNQTFADSRCIGEVSINKSSSALAAWAFAWEQQASCLRGDIFFAVVNEQGGSLQSASQLDASSADERRPAVAGDGRDFLVAWQQEQATRGNFDIVAALVSGSIAGGYGKSGATRNLSVLEPGGSPTLAQSDPALCFDGRRFVLTYTESQAITRPYAMTIFFTGSGLIFQEGHVLLSTTPRDASSTRVATKGAVGGARPEAMVVWQEVSASAGHGRDIAGAFFAARPTASGVTILPAHCNVGRPFSIRVSDPPTIGAAFEVTLQNPTAIPILMIGVDLPSLPLCQTSVATCRLLVQPIVSLPLAKLATQLPNDPTLFGATLTLQGLDVNSNNACPSTLLGLPFGTSDAARVTLR
ncbi:MAG TPA: hypothetical protein PKE00_05410, partial [Planctomycetota bacterium]|nr:hypothetical protein [Planctomycetota bacterium]